MLAGSAQCARWYGGMIDWPGDCRVCTWVGVTCGMASGCCSGACLVPMTGKHRVAAVCDALVHGTARLSPDAHRARVGNLRSHARLLQADRKVCANLRISVVASLENDRARPWLEVCSARPWWTLRHHVQHIIDNRAGSCQCQQCVKKLHESRCFFSDVFVPENFCVGLHEVVRATLAGGWAAAAMAWRKIFLQNS